LTRRPLRAQHPPPATTAPLIAPTTVSTLDLRSAPQGLLTPRLRLEAPALHHAAAFSAGVQASREALDFVAWRQRPCDLAWAQGFCQRDADSRAAGLDLAFHVLTRDGGDWVGRIDVHSIDFDAARGEIGYVGDVRLSGRGLMREAVRAVITMCFDIGFERIEAMSDARNARALHFADSLGLLQREGVLRRHERDLAGLPCDMVLWAALNPRGPLPVVAAA
jgi:RimJ/RimL family protein N-acetyltransferase